MRDLPSVQNKECCQRLNVMLRPSMRDVGSGSGMTMFRYLITVIADLLRDLPSVQNKECCQRLNLLVSPGMGDAGSGSGMTV